MAVPRQFNDNWSLPQPKKLRMQSVEVIDLEALDDGSPINEFLREKNSEFHHRAVPQTPPASRCETPLAKYSLSSRADVGQGPRSYRSIYPPVPAIRLSTVETTSAPLRLPSLKEFEQGVEELIKFHGHSTSSPPPSLSLTPTSSQASPNPRFNGFRRQLLHSSPSPSRDGHFYTHQAFSSPLVHGASVYIPNPESPSTKYSGYPSPPPDDARHINKKYTTEEGDFIIYALHDKKQKWATITRDFASQFGTVPERTTSGLQAWYYRMNLRIPVWDEHGWLIFDNEEDEEPRTVAIKCRHKASEGMGLAQRYPERMVEYEWVDEASKREARDWASKRNLQIRQRREMQRNMAFSQMYD